MVDWIRLASPTAIRSNWNDCHTAKSEIETEIHFVTKMRSMIVGVADGSNQQRFIKTNLVTLVRLGFPVGADITISEKKISP